MKKMFTLFLTLCIISILCIAKAQSVYISYQPIAKPLYTTAKMHNYNNYYSFSRQEKDYQIAKINQQYNTSVKALFNVKFVSPDEKIYLIRNMEIKKDAEIKAINTRFNNMRNIYNDGYYDRNYNRINR